jgi:hypothetical protein
VSERPEHLAVEADLDVSVGGEEFSVVSVGNGERLLVEAPSLAAGVRAAHRAPPKPYLERLDAALRTGDLAAEIRVRETTVATLGAGSRPGALSRRLGATPFEIRALGALAAVGREVTVGVRALADVLG